MENMIKNVTVNEVSIIQAGDLLEYIDTYMTPASEQELRKFADKWGYLVGASEQVLSNIPLQLALDASDLVTDICQLLGLDRFNEAVKNLSMFVYDGISRLIQTLFIKDEIGFESECYRISSQLPVLLEAVVKELEKL